jgi:hypothetical protein
MTTVFNDNGKLNQYQVLEAKTPHAVVGVEGEDARVDNRFVPSMQDFYRLVINLYPPDSMLKDDRVKQTQNRSIFVNDDFSDRMG